MPLPDLHVTPVRSRAELKEFVRLPWKVYRGDPNWVPPLIADSMKLFDRDHHPFHRHADVECFLARRGATGLNGAPAGEVVGRIAAFVNHAHNEFHGENIGFFGFFETMPDPRVASALLQAAAGWLRERQVSAMRGPANFSSNEEWALLIDGFDSPPKVMMTYNPPEYARYLEDFGFVKAKDLVAYWMDSTVPIPERYERLAEEMARREGITIRSLDKKRMDREIEVVRAVYNSAWEKNWGFVPMTPAEFDHMAKELKPVVDPDFVLFVEVEGKPVGFTLALPDLNQALKVANGRLWPFGLVRMLTESKRIRTVRVLTLGVVSEYRRQGIDVLMYLQLWKNGLRRGMRGGEFSWILEDNVPMRRALDRMGARVYKTYRLYDYPLAP